MQKSAQSMKKGLTCLYQSACLQKKRCEGASLDNIWMIVSVNSSSYATFCDVPSVRRGHGSIRRKFTHACAAKAASNGSFQPAEEQTNVKRQKGGWSRESEESQKSQFSTSLPPPPFIGSSSPFTSQSRLGSGIRLTYPEQM